MEDDSRWALFLATLLFGVGVSLVVDGVGPEPYSYATVVIVFIGAVTAMSRHIVDTRAARHAARAEALADADDA